MPVAGHFLIRSQFLVIPSRGALPPVIMPVMSWPVPNTLLSAGAALPLKPAVLPLLLPTATCYAQEITASIAVVPTVSTSTITPALPRPRRLQLLLPPVSNRSPIYLAIGPTTGAGCKPRSLPNLLALTPAQRQRTWPCVPNAT